MLRIGVIYDFLREIVILVGQFDFSTFKPPIERKGSGKTFQTKIKFRQISEILRNNS